MEADRKYRQINHTADLGIEVYGKGLQELFANAGFALFDIMTDLSLVKETTKKALTVEGNDLEQLMVNWLNDLLFLYDVEGLLFKSFEVQAVDEHHLEAIVAGEPYNAGRHVIETSVKAATYHQIQVVNENDKWRATIIIDL